jgi:hypothetical protein
MQISEEQFPSSGLDSLPSRPGVIVRRSPAPAPGLAFAAGECAFLPLTSAIQVLTELHLRSVASKSDNNFIQLMDAREARICFATAIPNFIASFTFASVPEQIACFESLLNFCKMKNSLAGLESLFLTALGRMCSTRQDIQSRKGVQAWQEIGPPARIGGNLSFGIFYDVLSNVISYYDMEFLESLGQGKRNAGLLDTGTRMPGAFRFAADMALAGSAVNMNMGQDETMSVAAFSGAICALIGTSKSENPDFSVCLLTAPRAGYIGNNPSYQPSFTPPDQSEDCCGDCCLECGGEPGICCLPCPTEQDSSIVHQRSSVPAEVLAFHSGLQSIGSRSETSSTLLPPAFAQSLSIQTGAASFMLLGMPVTHLGQGRLGIAAGFVNE